MKTYFAYPTKEKEEIFRSFLEAYNIPFFVDEEINAELPQHVLDGIAKGQAQIAAGHFITHEEFKKKFPIE